MYWTGSKGCHMELIRSGVGARMSWNLNVSEAIIRPWFNLDLYAERRIYTSNVRVQINHVVSLNT